MSKTDLNELHSHLSCEFKRLKSVENADELRPQIVSLKREIENIGHLLPSHQQLSYLEQIKELQEKAKSVSRPTRRIKINRDRKNEVKADDEVLKVEEERSPMPKRENQLITVTGKSTTVSDLKDSIVITDELDSFTIKNFDNCVLSVHSNGPLFVHNASNSLVYAKCHQLRVHDSSNVKFITDIKSNGAIIEGCKDLKFNEGLKVNDFSHPFGTSSNYTVFKPTESQEHEIRSQTDTCNLSRYLELIQR